MAVAEAEAELAEAKGEVIDALQDLNKKSTIQRRDGKRLTFTVARKTTTTVDEKGLRKALGAKVFDRYTERKLKNKKLEEAIEIGDIDGYTVAKYLTVTQGAPYITYTEKDDDDEE